MSRPYALITGASSGLGKCLATECALNGYDLVLVALPGTKLSEAAFEIAEKTSRNVLFVETDLTLECGPQQVFDFCANHNLHVRILINNAGIGLESSFETVPLSYCTSLMQLNTLAVVKMIRLFLPHLKLWPASFILNVSSLASYTPMPFKGIYSASKAFVNSFSCSLRTELKGSGVSISVLSPGGIPTNELIRQRIQSHGWFARAGMMEPDQLAAIAIKGMFQRKDVIIPGLLNQISKILMDIIPSYWQQKILYTTYRSKIELSDKKEEIIALTDSNPISRLKRIG